MSGVLREGEKGLARWKAEGDLGMGSGPFVRKQVGGTKELRLRSGT